MITSNKRILIMGVAVGLLLLVPFVAMQLTSEVQWSLLDFIVAGVLLFSTGIICEWVIRKFKKRSHRIIGCSLILLACLLIWIELAVGVFGSIFAGQ